MPQFSNLLLRRKKDFCQEMYSHKCHYHQSDGHIKYTVSNTTNYNYCTYITWISLYFFLCNFRRAMCAWNAMLDYRRAVVLTNPIRKNASANCFFFATRKVQSIYFGTQLLMTSAQLLLQINCYENQKCYIFLSRKHMLVSQIFYKDRIDYDNVPALNLHSQKPALKYTTETDVSLQ